MLIIHSISNIYLTLQFCYLIGPTKIARVLTSNNKQGIYCKLVAAPARVQCSGSGPKMTIAPLPQYPV